MEIKLIQKQHIQHYLKEFTDLSIKLDEGGEKNLSEYWKGQVMGICKIITILHLDIDKKYYLDQLP